MLFPEELFFLPVLGTSDHPAVSTSVHEQLPKPTLILGSL